MTRTRLHIACNFSRSRWRICKEQIQSLNSLAEHFCKYVMLRTWLHWIRRQLWRKRVVSWSWSMQLWELKELLEWPCNAHMTFDRWAFDSLKRKILTVWKRKFWQFKKGKFWQFEKENFDSLKREILTVENLPTNQN